MIRLVRALTLIAIASLASPLRAEDVPKQSSGGFFEALPFETAQERIARVQRNAEAGDPQAQSRLAILYRTGLGVGQSDGLAFAWMKRAAEAGDPAAQHYVGLFHLSGIGTAVDLNAASLWLRRCADANDTDSLVNLAWFAADEDPIGQLAGQTASLLRNSAEQGAKNAEEALRFLRQERERVAPEGNGAALRAAADMGDREAQYQLALALLEGRDIAPDPQEAATWLWLAAEQGDPRAMRRLGISHLTGAGVPLDRSLAYQWFLLAERHGDSMATQDVVHLDELLDSADRERASVEAAAWDREHGFEATAARHEPGR